MKRLAMVATSWQILRKWHDLVMGSRRYRIDVCGCAVYSQGIF